MLFLSIYMQIQLRFHLEGAFWNYYNTTDLRCYDLVNQSHILQSYSHSYLYASVQCPWVCVYYLFNSGSLAYLPKYKLTLAEIKKWQQIALNMCTVKLINVLLFSFDKFNLFSRFVMPWPVWLTKTVKRSQACWEQPCTWQDHPWTPVNGLRTFGNHINGIYFLN